MKIGESSELVSRAIETYDHLLWQAIINLCGIALSRSFRQEGNRVRVVYMTHNFDPEIEETVLVDPREVFPQIEGEVRRLISLALPIKKLGNQERPHGQADEMCSSYSYRAFLLDKIMGNIDSVLQGGPNCDFVEIGSGGQDDYICCPCVGEHLANTRDLQGFEIDLQQPKRVGRDTYEFRFEVSPKST